MSTEGPTGSHPKEALSWRTMALALNLESQPGGGGRKIGRTFVSVLNPFTLLHSLQNTRDRLSVGLMIGLQAALKTASPRLRMN